MLYKKSILIKEIFHHAIYLNFRIRTEVNQTNNSPKSL